MKQNYFMQLTFIATVILLGVSSCSNPLVQFILNDINTTEAEEQLPKIIVKCNGQEITNTDGFYEFESVDQLYDGEPVEFTIENAGEEVLSLEGDPKINITGTDTSHFIIIEQPRSPVFPNESTTFSVLFSPDSAGNKTAELSILSNDPEIEDFVFSVIGKGLIGNLRISDSFGTAIQSIISNNGTNYNIIWSDTRNTDSEIYYARIDNNGQNKSGDLRITNGINNSNSPDIVWNGSNYGITWFDYRDNDDGEIYFSIVNGLGEKQLGEIKLTTGAVYQYSPPSISWSGSEFGICWQDERNGMLNGEIYFTRVDTAGIEQGDDVRISNDPAYSTSPSLVWNGTEYGLAYADDREGLYDIYFARISETGSKEGGDIRLTSAIHDSTDCTMIWNGSNYVLVWVDSRYGPREILFAQLDTDGSKIGTERRITNSNSNSEWPKIAWNGSGYGITWSDDRGNVEYEYDIYFKLVTASGEPLTEDILVSKGTASGPASVTYNGEDFGIVWVDERNGANELYFARVNNQGEKY